MSDDLCHSCPHRGDCMLADSESAPERCTYHQRATEAEAAYNRMVAARIDRQMINRVIGTLALATGQTPRQVRDQLRQVSDQHRQGGIRQ